MARGSSAASSSSSSSSSKGIKSYLLPAASRKKKIKILYCTPELIATERFRSQL